VVRVCLSASVPETIRETTAMAMEMREIAVLASTPFKIIDHLGRDLRRQLRATSVDLAIILTERRAAFPDGRVSGIGAVVDRGDSVRDRPGF
jgi:hypothetical protein